MSPDEVLAGLDPDQQEAARAVRGPVCVLAGAGTGKTRTVTHRIAYAVLCGVVRADHVLAVTFTNRAAGVMRSRLRRLGVPGAQARTFHSAALRQLAHFWPLVVGGHRPALTAGKAPLVAEAAARCRVDAGPPLVRDLAAEIEWAKVCQVAPEAYEARAVAAGRRPTDAASVARVYAAYEDVKRERARIDFEDVLLLTVGMLVEHDEVAAEVRSRYRYLVVDEYQDVNPLQQRLLDCWLGDRDDVCVVGDANQTIYTFAGADARYLQGFPTRHPGATVVRLVRDYRSTPQVVALANRLGSTGLTLVGQRAPGPEPTLDSYADEPAEAAGVAARIRSLLAQGTRPREIAVLFRTNAQSVAYEQVLDEASVPYALRDAERFFDRPEVREAVLLLRGAARSEDATYGAPSDGSGLAGRVRHVLSGAGWSPQPPSGPGAVRERWESLAALVGLATEIAASRPGAGLADVVAEIEARAATAYAPTVDAVTLASLHAAKGLEWDAVFLVGLADGTVPIHYASTPAQVAEERRLLYVGVTRAREHLALSWAVARNPGGPADRRPSPFLERLLAPGGGTGGRRAGHEPVTLRSAPKNSLAPDSGRT